MTQRDEQLVASAPSVPFDEAALDCAADAVVAIDADLRVLSWNTAASELYGISAPEMIGRRFTEHVTCHPVVRPRGMGVNRHALSAAGLLDGPATHLLATGRQLPVSVSILPLCLDRGESLHLIVVRDNAEQAWLADALKERREFETYVSELSSHFSQLAEEQVDHEIEVWLSRLAAVLNVDGGVFAQLTPDGVWVVTHSCAARGQALCSRGPVNASLPWLTGEILTGRTVLLSQIPTDLPPHAVDERRCCADAGMQAAVVIPILICGSAPCVLTFCEFGQPRIWPDDLVAQLRIAGDAFGNAVARRGVKRRLEEKQHELVHVGRVAAMGELASVIAHELDQPLTVVVSNAEALRHSLRLKPPDLADADEELREITDAAMRASEIIRRERKLLRKGPRETEPVDLNDAVREIELFVRAQARQFGSRLMLELVPGLPAVLGDRVQLQQVVFNLARNAMHAMRAQPAESRTLTISTVSGSDTVTLRVTDAGPAVDPLVLRRMFEPFYTTTPGGLGMGLSISKSIVETHRGRIWAAANISGGLTMSVSLPRK